MIKWIISDMDGTLLDDNSNLPRDFDETMSIMQAHDIIFSPASGRQYYALAKQFAKYKDDWLFIAENGAMIVAKNKLLHSAEIARPLCQKIITTLSTSTFKNMFPVVCTCKGSYVTKEDNDFLAELNRYYTNHFTIEDFSQIKEPIIKIALCDCKGMDIKKNAYDYLLNYKKDLQVIMSTDMWVDFLANGVNKGNAITKMQEELGIKPEECMAFGNFYNDIDMLKIVGESYAMDNAIPEVKRIAKHIAPNNNDAGVTAIIKQLLQKH